jgi:hypothetical protein
MGVDPNSIVDYLKRHKQASDFQSRRILWGQFDPREAYTGSPKQNSRLLSALRIGEAAPELEFLPPLIPVNGEIRARIRSQSTVLIENGLTLSSSNAEPTETISLGTANRFGMIPLHVRNESVSSRGQLVLLPQDGQVRVDWWAVPTETTEESIMVTITDSSLVSLLEQFSNHFQDVATEAAKRASKEFLEAVKASGILMDVFAGTVLLLIPGGGTFTFIISTQLAQYFLDFAASFIKHAVQLAPQPALQTDKDAVINTLTAPITVARVGLSVVKAAGSIGNVKNLSHLRKNLDICDSIVELDSLAGWVVEQYIVPADGQQQSLQVAGSVLRSAVDNVASIVCAARKAK